MKISQLLILILALLVSGIGVKYALDQQKVMQFLVAVNGQDSSSGIQAKAAALQVDLDAARLTRASANEAAEQTRLEKNDADDKKKAADANLQAKKDELADYQAQVKAQQVLVEQKKAEYQAAMDQLSADLKDQLPDLADSDLNSYTQAVKDYVQSTTEEIATLGKKIDETIVVRTGLTSSVAGLNVDLDRVHAIQKKFSDEYSQNSTEYVVADVDHRWFFVVFFADPKDGLLPGDTIPLLGVEDGNAIGSLEIESVNGNVVVARYDVKTLPAGRTIQVGDRLFRKVPLGH